MAISTASTNRKSNIEIKLIDEALSPHQFHSMNATFYGALTLKRKNFAPVSIGMLDRQRMVLSPSLLSWAALVTPSVCQLSKSPLHST